MSMQHSLIYSFCKKMIKFNKSANVTIKGTAKVYKLYGGILERKAFLGEEKGRKTNNMIFTFLKKYDK